MHDFHEIIELFGMPTWPYRHLTALELYSLSGLVVSRFLLYDLGR